MNFKKGSKKKIIYICPVCGYDKLSEPPYDKFGDPSYEICPCCGFEFGYDDLNLGFDYKTYRGIWIGNGAKWFSEEEKPNEWDLERQLHNIKESEQ